MRFWLLAGLTVPGGCSEYQLDDSDDDAPDTGDLPSPPGEPVADAGVDRELQPLEELMLDATASYDPESRRIVASRWTVVSAPDGSQAEVSDQGASVFLDLAGTYVLSLTVQNDAGVWDSTPDELVVTAVPRDGFYVELTWSGHNDLDLHLLNGTSPLFGPGDCSFCNMAPSWGASGTADDPSLDRDAVFGLGPETVTIDQPGAGVFDVRVHYYGELGLDRCKGPCESSVATVRVYLGGALAGTFTRTLDAQGDLWQVATIRWPDRTIEALDVLDYTDRTSCR